MNAKPETYLLESRLIGTALDSGLMPELSPSDFHVEEFSLLWSIMQSYTQEHGPFDYVVLGDYLFQTRGLDKRDWLGHMAQQRVPDNALVESYANSLRAHSDRVDLSETLTDLAARSRNEEPGELRDEALEKLRAISVRKRDEIVKVREALAASLETLEARYNAGKNPGVPTGIPRLDEKLGGWQRGDLALLAARPAVGKTALMCNLALAADCRVGIVSTEQPSEQIVNRLAAIAGWLPAWKFRAPRSFNDDEWPRITEAFTHLATLDITIMDNTSPTIGDIERAFRDIDIDILFVDYAQRIKAPGEIYERVSSVARGLKDIARNFDIPVVALAQINRQGAKNAGMEHLKGSGDLEQEADEVLILERGESENTAVLTLEKNRHGPTGAIDLIFNAPTLCFREAAYDMEQRR